MGNCPEEIKDYMHDYLDESISPEHEKVLREHLASCSDCKQYLYELEKTTAFVKSTSHIKAPDDFTQKVLMSLPREKKKVSVKRWFGHHPIFTAAAVFIILMTTSFLSTWNTGEDFSVTKQENIVVENSTAIVPVGEIVEGDIIVKNGDIRIDGKVEGNVTVINGEKFMASAGEVTGEIEEINEAFEWLWFQIKNSTNDLIGLFSGD